MGQVLIQFPPSGLCYQNPQNSFIFQHGKLSQRHLLHSPTCYSKYHSIPFLLTQPQLTKSSEIFASSKWPIGLSLVFGKFSQAGGQSKLEDTWGWCDPVSQRRWPAVLYAALCCLVDGCVLLWKAMLQGRAPTSGRAVWREMLYTADAGIVGLCGELFHLQTTTTIMQTGCYDKMAVVILTHTKRNDRNVQIDNKVKYTTFL